MNGVIDYLGSFIGMSVPVHVRVRLQGKRDDFSFETYMWPNNDDRIRSATNLIEEVCQLSSELPSGELNPLTLFVYVEKQSEIAAVSLERLEDTSIIHANMNIRVQQWSDATTDDGKKNGDQSSLSRLHILPGSSFRE